MSLTIVGVSGAMFKKILSFLAIVLIGLSVAYPAYTQSITGITQTQADELVATGYGVGCKVRCQCEAPTNGGSDSVFSKTMKEYTEDNADACWYCSMFMQLFEEVNKMATAVFDRLSTSFLALLGVGILFIILFKVGKLVLQFKAVDVMQFLGDLFKPLGRAIIATALLYGVTTQTDNVFSMITSPIFEVSTTIGVEIMDTAIDGEVKYISSGTGEDTYVYKAGKCSIDTTQTDGRGGVFTKGQGELLECWMKQVASSFITGIAIGSSLVSVGWERTGLLGNITMIITGAVMMLCFFLLYIIFPFKLVDAFVRMAFVLCLMPLWIVLWVFPITSAYTKRAWEMFLNACLLLIILSIMVSFALILMSNAIPEEDLKGLLQCLRAGNDKSAATWIVLGSGALLNTIAFFALSWMLLGTAAPLANSFVNGGGNLGIGDGLIGSSVKAANATYEAAKGVGNVGLLGLGALGGLATAAGRRSGGGSGSGSGGSGTGGSAPAAHRGTFNGGSDDGETTRNNTTTNDDQKPEDKPVNSNDKKSAEDKKTTETPNTQSATSETQPTPKPVGEKTPEEKEAIKQAKEEQTAGKAQEQDSERSTEKINQETKSEQEDRAKDTIKQSQTAEQNTRTTADIETQRQRQTETTGLKMTRREEAIHKLRENPIGSQIVRDTATNIAFIQEQMQSATSVSDLNDRLKGHDWQYSGNDREGYARMMANSAETMMNSHRFGISDSMNYKIKDMLTDAFKHGSIADADELVKTVMEKVSGNPALLSEILNNLTKKE